MHSMVMNSGTAFEFGFKPSLNVSHGEIHSCSEFEEREIENIHRGGEDCSLFEDFK